MLCIQFITIIFVMEDFDNGYLLVMDYYLFVTNYLPNQRTIPRIILQLFFQIHQSKLINVPTI